MKARSVAIAVAVILAATLAGAAAVNFTQTSGSITLETNSGVAVTTDQHGGGMALSDPFVDDDTVSIVTENGNLTVSGTGPANVTIDQFGTPVVVSQLDVSNTAVTLNPDDRARVTISGDVESFEYYTPVVDDGARDFVYNGSSGSTTVTVRGLPANSVIAAVEGSTTLDKAETDGNGVVTFTLPNSKHTISLQTSTTNDPELSDPDPVGPQSDTPSELAVNVSDDDFSAEEVQVNISLDGTQLQSTNITSNSRVTTSLSSVSPGSHEWTVRAEDSYGNVETTTYEFSVPSNATIYNESAPTQKLDTITVEASVYQDGDLVFNRTTTNGTIPLEGLPATEDLVIELSADGYYQRTIIVEDLSEQQRFYLLPTNVSAFDVRFEVDDPTGEFPTSESQLFIKRALSLNNSTSFQVIAADEFGPAGYTETLEEGVRYRLVLKNEDNDVRTLGAYEAVTSETVTLRPGGLELQFNQTTDYAWDFTFDNSTGTPTLTYEYVDPANATRNLVITIHERGNESNTLTGYPVRYEGPVGTVRITETLTSEQADTEWEVEWEADRNGREIDSSQSVSELVEQFGELPDWVQLWASLGLILMVGGLFSRANIGVGGVSVALLSGVLWFVGWLGAAATGASVVVGLTIAVVSWVGNRGV